MSSLLNEIKRYNEEAASVLQDADFDSDCEIRSLTREDLHELFPGHKQLKLRRKIYDIINKKKTTNELLRDLEGFISKDSLSDALSGNGVLVDYLCHMKELYTQLNNVQEFLKAHIDLLERNRRTDSEPRTLQSHYASTQSSNGVEGESQDLNQDRLQIEQTGECSDQNNVASANQCKNDMMATGMKRKGSNMLKDIFNKKQQEIKVTMRYKSRVCGETFNADVQMMGKLKALAGELNLIQEDCDDFEILLVFCPIVSRMGTDVEAALRDVTDNKPIVLVLMHHVYEPKHVPTPKTWSEYPKINLYVNIFFHERSGLLNCKENEDAILAIKRELLKCGNVPEQGGFSAKRGPSNTGASAEKNDSWLPFWSRKT